MGQDSAVDIVTHDELDDLGIDSQWGGEIFCACPGQGVALTTHSHLVPRLKKE